MSESARKIMLLMEQQKIAAEKIKTPETPEQVNSRLAHEYAAEKVGKEQPAIDSIGYYEYWDAYYGYVDNYLSGNVTPYGDLADSDSDSCSYEYDDFNEMPEYYDSPLSRGDQPEVDKLMFALDSLAQFLNYVPNKKNEQENTSGYTFFRTEEARENLFDYSEAIAGYIKRNGIKDLVIPDRSARPLYVGVMEYWKKFFSNDPMPGIYFVNPKGFMAGDVLPFSELSDVNANAGLKDDLFESPKSIRDDHQIKTEFKQAYPKLMADKKKPILIFDTCIHSGKTLESVIRVMRDLGFTGLKIGSVNPSDHYSVVKTDFHITEEEPEKGCYPFDGDRLIEKTFEHVFSNRTPDATKRATAGLLRQEIKKIMAEFLKLV